uniref:Microtubule-binding protein TANGLED n=1 Tax=Gossypium raimondii TaxID=29730 RepID=A0A0D2PHN9_GOSRA|nr:hypothetical protein B456_004G241800 [Gossypium raimondii]
MVARTPPKQRKFVVAPLNPVLLRETVKKVEKCMARLQELQLTVAGGSKVISGVSLSPRSTRGYMRTSLRCKQESLRMKNSTPRKSPVGKFPATAGGEWRRMSLPAMLVGETVGEILQANQFARQILAAADNKTKNTSEDPKTPLTEHRKQRTQPENTEEFDKENSKHMANRVSPRNRPWAKKTVLFPNPLFSSAPTSQQQKFFKTRSPVIARNRQTPHKFLIKSPPSASKFQVKIKSLPVVSLSPTRSTNTSKKSPKVSAASKLRRSFSPSRLANRLMSPLKSRISLRESDAPMSGLKQRPALMSIRSSTSRV